MKNFKKLVLTLMLVAAMSAMYVVSAFAATGTFYVSKDGGATYQKAPSHAQNAIANVKVEDGYYTIRFQKINWVVASGHISEFNYKAVDYSEGNVSKPITKKYVVKTFKLKNGGTITGAEVQFKVEATLPFGIKHNHAYDRAVLVIQ